MTEKPILFSGPMVRAILAGTKTQTRRVCKLDGLTEPDLYETRDGDLIDPVTLCPYGQTGNRLWVRETWAPNDCECEGPCGCPWYVYRADDWAQSADPEEQPRWRPSIYMPRTACRLTLELTAVRVERLQDVTDDDAFAEGVLPNWTGPRHGQNPAPSGAAFAALWDSINGPRGFGWDANPWVWALTFRRMEATP
jgi:hypothetical protein